MRATVLSVSLCFFVSASGFSQMPVRTIVDNQEVLSGAFWSLPRDARSEHLMLFGEKGPNCAALNDKLHFLGTLFLEILAYVRGGYLTGTDLFVCDYCGFISVCGPYEPLRMNRKNPERIVPLMRLRDRA